MYNEWSLDAFYKGIDDPVLEKDMARLEEVIGIYKQTVNDLTKDDPASSLHRVLEISE